MEKGIMSTCEYCGKLLYQNNKYYIKRFCSVICGGKRTQEIHKRNGTGFFSFKNQSKAGKIGSKKAHQTLKKQKRGFWGMTMIRKLEIVAKNKENKKGWFGMSHEEHQSAGQKAVLSNRLNKNILFLGLNFDSFLEAEIGLCIYFQFEKLEVNNNFQIQIGNLTYDFLISGTFIEYHPWDRHFTDEEYYKKRRINLNNNGYGNYGLIILK